MSPRAKKSIKLNNNYFLETLSKKPVCVWDKKVPNIQLEEFKLVIEKKYGLQFESYWDFHKWSIEHNIDFWKEIWYYFKIVSSVQFDKVFTKTGIGFLDNKWFEGARFNFAENLLRFRDDTVGLICEDEFMNRESFSFTEIFVQVKLYAAALRKCGVGVGDRVGCYMSNRKEGLFAMLATTSIGAMWSGVFPYYGARAASKIMNFVDPKVIFTVDHFTLEGDHFYPVLNMTHVARNVPNLEKIVVVITGRDQSFQEMPCFPNSTSLEDFLKRGKNPNGSVPDLHFEQLPFDQPTVMNFTSGTTGMPKGVVHTSGSLIAQLRDFAIHLNLKRGDVVYNHHPIGWSSWDYQIPSLALGVTLFLFEGSPEYEKRGVTIWEQFSRNRVTYAFIATAYVDYLEKKCIVPDAKTNLDSLKTVVIGGSPPRPRNYEFLLNKVKKDMFVSSLYGSTEVFGIFSGYDFNLPGYSCEIQVPALGVDLHCYDNEGNSVIGQRGEMVIATPSPSFPLCLWKDLKNERMEKSYLTKYKGVWSQSDECFINPKTRGTIVIGRSDDTLTQGGERFSSGDIYFAIDQMEELQDYICVGQDKWDGITRAILFVKLKNGLTLTPELKEKIEDTITEEMSEDYIPEVIMEIADIPYTLSNKRMESAVRKIVATNEVPEVSNIRNPGSLQLFCNIPQLVQYNEIQKIA